VVDQVFQTRLGEPGGVSARHAHGHTTDRLFVTEGLMRIVLYDARTGSRTHGHLIERRFGLVRPALAVVPPGVWHGIQNLASTPSVVLNLVDRAYDYDDPDHRRLPPHTEQIPLRFA
jgi:dTDP-4-dehydrorhamnose 3,5-epimerase